MRTKPFRGGKTMAPALEALELRQMLAVGVLDAGYGTGGTATGLPSGVATSLVPLPDGGVLIAGTINDNFAIAKISFDGILDSSFGVNGLVTTNVGGVDALTTMIRQPTGKFIAAGISNVAGFSMVRYNSDFSIDTTFGAGGFVFTTFDPRGGGPSKLISLNNGGFVALGTTDNGKTRGAIARYDADGHLDATFGSGGKVTFDLASQTGGLGGGFADGFALPDGGLVVAGTGYYDNHYNPNHNLLLKYLPNGALDPSFGVGGIGSADPYFGIADVMPAPDGGYYTLSGNYALALAKWTAQGAIDTTFGNQGYVQLTIEKARAGGAMAVQADGSIIVSHAYEGGYLLARVFPNGQLDTSFANGVGVFIGHLPVNYPEGGNQLLLQPDGRALICADSFNNIGGAFAIRYRTMPDPPVGARAEYGILTINGDDKANTVGVSVDANNWYVTVDTVPYIFARASAVRVDARLLGGDDTLTIGAGVPTGVIDLGDGNDAARIANGGISIQGGAGNDTMEFPAQATGTTVTANVLGGLGTDQILLSGSADADTFLFNISGIQVPGQIVNFSDFEGVTVDGAANNDTLQLTGGSGADSISVGATGLDGFGLPIVYQNLEAMVVSLLGGDDQITVDSPAISSLQVIAGDGNDSLDLRRNAASTQLAFNGEAGNDTVTVYASNTASVSFLAGLGSDTVRVFGSAQADNIALGADTISSTAGASVKFVDPAALELLQVIGDGGNDQFSLARSTLGVPTSITGGAGVDVYDAGASSLLGSSNVTFDGGGDAGDAAILVDSGLTGASYSLSAGTVLRNGVATMKFSRLDQLSLSLGAGNDTFSMNNANGFSSIRINGGAGDDTFSLLQNSSGLGMDAGAKIVLAGEGGNDTISVRPDNIAQAYVYGGAAPADAGAPPAPYDPTDGVDHLVIDPGALQNARLYWEGVGRGQYIFANRRPVNFAEIETVNDLVAPASAQMGFSNSPVPAVQVALPTDPDLASLTASDLVLTNLTLKQVVPIGFISLSYDPLKKLAIFSFPGYPGGVLPEGNYRASVWAGAFTDAGGNPLSADLNFDFTVSPAPSMVPVIPAKPSPLNQLPVRHLVVVQPPPPAKPKSSPIKVRH